MKKILISSLTFALGVAAFNLLEIKEVSVPATFTAKHKAVEKSELKAEIFPLERIANPESPKKVKALKPFFDSFSSNLSKVKEYQGYSGWFIADNFKGMKEVWTILLNRDIENSKNGNLAWSAMILTQNADGSSNDDDNFKSIWIKTEANHLSFKTNKIRGIEYKFDGEFFRNGNDFSNNEKVLRGTLQKIVKGKQVAKLTSNFAYNEPHCFH